jgi:hypothetical protein
MLQFIISLVEPFILFYKSNFMTFRTTLFSGLCLAFIVTTAVAVRAQTVDEIVNKHVDALGGKDKLLSVRSLYMEGTAVMANGTEINTKTWKVQGKLYRQEIDFGMGNVVLIATPTGGWMSNPRTGGEFKPLPEEQLKAMQGQMDPVDPLVDYAARGNKAELDGKDTVGGNACYRVKVTFPSGQTAVYSIDEKTYYVLRETRKGGGMMGGGAAGGGNAGAGGGRRGGNPDGELRIEYADYKKTPDGIVFPYTIIAGGFGAKSSITKLDINSPVDVASLSKPK